MTKEKLLAEEHICNGKCQDDITKNYVHCKVCTRLNDFLAGLEVGKPKWHYIKNNDYPEQTEDPVIVELYCLYKAAKRTELHFGYYSFEDKHWYELYNDEEPVDYEVVAWKEVLLPEEDN